MKKKFKGFSLAELLIALLVISIVLSAAIPTITKRSAGGEKIWRWSMEHDNNYSNSAYFGVGATQSAIIGATNIPSISNPLATASGEEMANVKFSHSGDKLVLIKQTTRAPGDESIDSNMINSHISFFTLFST